MAVRPSLGAIRRWRSVVVAGGLIGGVVGWVSAAGAVEATPLFEASYTLIAGPQTGAASPIYREARLATRGSVPDRVAARLGIDGRLVRSMVWAESRADQAVLLIHGRSDNPIQAEALAHVTADELVAQLGGPASPLHKLEPGVARRIEAGEISAPRSRPGRALVMSAFGLLLGVGGALAVDRLDSRIRSVRQTGQALDTRVVSGVPLLPLSAGGANQVGTGPEFTPATESYRRLATVIDHQLERSGGRQRVLLVTSPEGGDGRTTTVAHLAAALAELGRSVLAISADLRQPRLHDLFGRPRDPGLVDILSGATALELLDLRTPIRSVRFLASGAPVDNPAPLLDQVGVLFGAARLQADVVLVDAPALLTVSDATQLARHADGVLFIVRAGRTSTRAAARSAELLRRLDIPVIGAVVVGTAEGTGLP